MLEIHNMEIYIFFKSIKENCNTRIQTQILIELQ